MRILLTSWAWPSHVLPMVPLGWALRSRGHEVRVAAPPSVAELVARSGLPFIEAGHDVDIAALKSRCFTGDDLGPASERVSAMFAAVAAEMVDGLDAVVGDFRPDLIVYDATTWAGPVVAAGRGVPTVRHLFGPDMTGRLGPAKEEALSGLRERFAPLDGVDDLCTVDPCPPSFQFSDCTGTERIRAVPYNGSGSIPPWVTAAPDRPRVCVTGGSGLNPGGAGSSMLDAVHDAGVRYDVEVVAAVPSGGAAGVRVPAGGRVVENLPLHVLLPTCAAMVHHGGAGSILAGFYHGVPQVAVPGIPEAAVNAGQLAATGAGPDLGAQPSSSDVLDAIRAAVEDEASRAAARRMAEEVAAQPSPAACASRIEDLVRLAPATTN